MTATLSEPAIQSIEIVKEEEIAAPIAIVFDTILEQVGPLNEKPDGTPLPMKIEPWPGGRWYRDLGGDSGHLWAHVQSIKPPSLLEFWGPLFMSAPAVSHVIYRLSEEGGITRVKFSHRAVGLIPQPTDAIHTGWGYIMSRIRKVAESKSRETKQ
jgi:uncharacterized protein YndB with AHSA1/START domain